MPHWAIKSWQLRNTPAFMHRRTVVNKLSWQHSCFHQQLHNIPLRRAREKNCWCGWCRKWLAYVGMNCLESWQAKDMLLLMIIWNNMAIYSGFLIVDLPTNMVSLWSQHFCWPITYDGKEVMLPGYKEIQKVIVPLNINKTMRAVGLPA